MDNHPIPQDVTNFQFRLIGDMTLKQFGYILGGIVLAWVMLASPLFFFLKFLLAAGFVVAAVVLAFVPLEGRPADIMIWHFIKALISPTQFVYRKKEEVKIAQTNTLSEKTQLATIAQAPDAAIKTLEKKEEKVQVESFAPVATAAVSQQVHETEVSTPITVPTIPVVNSQPTDQAQEEKIQQEEKLLAKELEEAKEVEKKAKEGSTQGAEAHEKVTSLEKELQEVMTQKQELEKQLVALQKSLNEKKKDVFIPTTAKMPEETNHVIRVPKQMQAGVGVPLVPDVPNLITGVIKDPRGNILNNILIEVKDKDGNPVRAFKTNQLGQFAAATPLANGIYTISFEDPAGKQSFDSVEITASGDILLPLEIISVDAREKLRQELFGTT